jgi:hypothetical protein
MTTRFSHLKRLSAHARLSLLLAICIVGAGAGTFGWVHGAQASRSQGMGRGLIAGTTGTPHVPGGGLPICHGWKIMPSPNVAGANGDVLAGVAVVSRTDVWAVGWSIVNTINNEVPTALVEHWNGSVWSIVTIPLPSGEYDSQLNAIAAASADDIWAVGGYLPSLTGYGATLIEHYDGNAWSIVPSPNGSFGPYPASNMLQAVAIEGTTAWAVGYLGPQPIQGETLAEEWNGTNWTLVPTPNPGIHNVLLGLTASPDGTVWAVGDQTTPPDSNLQTLIEQWTGTSWVAVASPNINGSYEYDNQLLGITTVAANDIWAVGNYANSADEVPYFEHWDGTAWSVISSASLPPAGNQSLLTSVSRYRAGSSLLFATGSMSIYAPNYGQAVTLAEHWSGSAWVQMPIWSPGPYWATPRLKASSSDLAGDVFAVGTTYTLLNSDASQTLVEEYTLAPCV